MADIGDAGKMILTDSDIDALGRFVHADGVDSNGILGYLQDIISKGLTDGAFTNEDVQGDLGIALWVAQACNALGTYDHFRSSLEWLSRVESKSAGVGEWYYRYSVAQMYCGKPGMASEYAERGVSEDPGYPWNWLILGKLRAHFGNKQGAFDAARKGMSLAPDSSEFISLLADIESGASLEEMEFGSLPADRMSEEELSARMLAIGEIVCDRENLDRIKTALGMSGWSPDHPYCTYLMDRGTGSVMVTFMMNEAQVSKLDPVRLSGIYDDLDRLDSEAKAYLAGNDRHDPLLYEMSVSPLYEVVLSYHFVDSEDLINVKFDAGLKLVEQREGGPYAGIVLLSDPSWDPDLVLSNLEKNWGITLSGAEKGDDSIIAAYGNHLVAFTLIRSPIPGDEAMDAAESNYLWNECKGEVSKHRAHILVALVNHGGDPVECGMDFVKMVDSCLRLPNAIGVYLNDTVYRPEFYFMETADFRNSGRIPVFVMVWVGLYRTSQGVSAYTVGMKTYARDEMEIVSADAEPFNVMNFMYDIISYLFSSGASFSDGDRFSITGDEVLQVTKSEGISVSGSSLKIQYPSRKD